MKSFILVSLLMVTGCSVEDFKAEKTAEEVAAEAKAAEEKAEYSSQSVLKGYISSAFEIEVDGKTYSDSEDFYTQQVEALALQANEAGYEGWNLSFDAQVGLDDLKHGMKVYIASMDNKGFAGESSVEYNGKFSISIPDSAEDVYYQIRANKKIGVTLTPPEGSTEAKVKWCYNFSGELKDVQLDGQSVVINQFATSLTKYKCSTETNGGIKIPTK